MYTKIIQSGDLVEKYEYEYAPATHKHRRGDKTKYPRRHIRRSDTLSRLRRHFYRTVRANIFRAAPDLLTLTMRDVREISAAYRYLTLFVQKLRRRHGDNFFYIAVPEFQKRGAVHFHILIWGFNQYVESERKTRYLATLWGHGYVDFIQTDGSPKLAGYLSKYMGKTMSDARLVGKKAFVASRNIMHPVSLSTPFQLDEFQKEFPLDTVENFPLQHCQFHTQWLGKCDYKQYQYYYARKNNP